MDTPSDKIEKAREPGAAAPAPAEAEVDTRAADAPKQQARRANQGGEGFSDTDGESVAIDGAMCGGDQGDY